MKSIAFAALIAVTSVCTTSPPLRVSPTMQDPATFHLEPGSHVLTELVDRAAAFLGRDVIWSDADRSVPDLSSTIRIARAMDLDADACEDVISSLLYSRGFALVPLVVEQGLFEVVAMAGQRRNEIPARPLYRTPDQALARPGLYMQVLTTVDLTHVDAKSVAQSLRPFLSQLGGITIVSNGTEDSISIQGFGPQVAQVLRMLATVDVPQTAPQGLAQRVAELAARVSQLEQQMAAFDQK